MPTVPWVGRGGKIRHIFFGSFTLPYYGGGSFRCDVLMRHSNLTHLAPVRDSESVWSRKGEEPGKVSSDSRVLAMCPYLLTH